MNDSSSFVYSALRTIWSIQWARYTSWIISSLTLPLRTASIPLSYGISALKTLLAPWTYLLSYFASWAAVIVGFLIGLEPLYTFFSVAAFIGVTAGVVMAVASAVVTSYLNLYDDNGAESDVTMSRYLEESQFLKDQYLKKHYLAQPQGLEPDWHWTDSTTAPKSPRYRRFASLQTQTIHEEEDDSEP